MLKKPARKALKAVGKRPAGGGEKGLQYRCQQWLVKSGLWDRLLIFHVANERKGSIGAAVHFKRMGVRPGVADYLAFAHGVGLAIELKDDGEQDSEQIKFEHCWRGVGFDYKVIRTLEHFQTVVQAFELFG